jgi:hypothetical protein
MTTTIKVTSHNYPAHVTVIDRVQGAEGPTDAVAEERVLKPEDSEQTFYCTTSRRLEIVDLEYDDPRATQGG